MTEKIKQLSVFETLSKIDVTPFLEHKPTGKDGKLLSYLSWAKGWQLVKEAYPLAHYIVREFDGKPYLFDENLGYIINTIVTIDTEVQDCWLPVMDFRNNTMRHIPYKNGYNEVKAATMFDINSTMQRCLIKNLAKHGLGINVYCGEDFSNDEEEKEKLKIETKSVTIVDKTPVKTIKSESAGVSRDILISQFKELVQSNFENMELANDEVSRLKILSAVNDDCEGKTDKQIQNMITWIKGLK